MVLSLGKKDKRIVGEIDLDGSKSISNRLLIIRALSGADFKIENLSTSKDTVTLAKLLASPDSILDTGAAGTTFRFMTAYLSLQPSTQILTGSERMKQRPIGVLVDALRQLGASIKYEEKKGYPPLIIRTPKQLGEWNELDIQASTSSQYISALLMIAPILPKGLVLNLTGKIVSRPYIEITLQLMQEFGIQYEWQGNTITIKPQSYLGKDVKVEADWSAASYYYALACFADELDLQLNGLFPNSTQGDAVLPEMLSFFGIKTIFNKKGVHLSKQANSRSTIFEWDFIKCPDIAQTLAVICGGLGVEALFTGLDTLRIKETDRIAALQNELSKVNVKLFEQKADYFKIEGKAAVHQPQFCTYEDHRMAMAFAPLAMLDTISVEEPDVVEKSYPKFWDDFQLLGIG